MINFFYFQVIMNQFLSNILIDQLIYFQSFQEQDLSLHYFPKDIQDLILIHLNSSFSDIDITLSKLITCYHKDIVMNQLLDSFISTYQSRIFLFNNIPFIHWTIDNRFQIQLIICYRCGNYFSCLNQKIKCRCYLNILLL